MFIGVDWGGTKIEGIALARDGRELRRLRRDTPRGDYEGCITLIKDLVDQIEAQTGLTDFYWHRHPRILGTHEPDRQRRQFDLDQRPAD